MTRPRPKVSGPPQANTAVLMREAFAAINAVVPGRLASRGHDAIRQAHGDVFQFLDPEGTTVSTLAQRAGMTKQAMAELVAYLEQHGYVRRERDPGDRRAKLVLLTSKGRQVMSIVEGLLPEMENRLIAALGRSRWQQLRDDLQTIPALFAEPEP